MDTKSYPVTASETGFYNNILRYAGDDFVISSPDHLGQWMIPNGWTPDKDAKLGAAAKVALKEIEQTETAAAAATEKKEPLTFTGFKEIYGDADGVHVTGANALEAAVSVSELELKDWNKLPQKDRKSYVLGQVQALMKEAQAKAAAE